MAKYTTGDLCDTLNQFNYDNWFGEEEAPDFVEELKACAFNIVRENPGIDRSGWIDLLIQQYPSEVVDAYGTNPGEVYHDLSDLWEMEYSTQRHTSGTASPVGLNISLQIQTHCRSSWNERKKG